MAKVKKDWVTIYNLFYIFISIVWEPLQLYYLHVDGAGYTLMMLSMVALLLNVSSIGKHRDVLQSFPYVCWFLLLLFATVNSAVQGMYNLTGPGYVLYKRLWEPCILLTISIIEFSKSRDQFLKVVMFALLAYMVLGFLHMGENEDNDRITAEGLGNVLPLTGIGTVFVASLLYNLREIKLWHFIPIVVLVAYSVLMAATRKAFGGTIIILVGMILSRQDKLTVGRVLVIAAFGILLYFGVVYVLGNTVLGERLTAEQEEIFYVPLSSNPKVNDFLMSVLGDRSLQYYRGLYEVFPEHPIAGVGLLNYPVVTYTAHNLHSEYLVHICENGIIGFTLFFLFYVSMGLRLIQNRKRCATASLSIWGLMAIMFINITAWTYTLDFVMIMYAIFICSAANKQTQYENCNM